MIILKNYIKIQFDTNPPRDSGELQKEREKREKKGRKHRFNSPNEKQKELNYKVRITIQDSTNSIIANIKHRKFIQHLLACFLYKFYCDVNSVT